jgi:nicotinamide mononucleotide (NMN) deamidase PncC
VGTVCLCVSTAEAAIERTVHLPGSRAHVRDRTTTTAMHMLHELLGPEVTQGGQPIVAIHPRDD